MITDLFPTIGCYHALHSITKLLLMTDKALPSDCSSRACARPDPFLREYDTALASPY